MESITYIHYGADHYDPTRFLPVRNGSWKPKPAERTGLWGSRINDPDGWKAWCEENNFLLDHLKCSFRFSLSTE